jgi:hypothetical protein
VNLISPLQYEEFVLPYDRRIASEFDMIGIHNCAWNADPYVPSYATIPNLAYVDMGLDSNLEKARRLLPHARRALMYAPTDLANKSMDAIQEDLEWAARNYAPCDVVVADIESGTPDERVLSVIECCAELSK